MVDTFQSVVLHSLITNAEYTRAVIPFIKSEYFDNDHRVLFHVIVNYVKKYNKIPTVDTLRLYFYDQTDNPVHCNEVQQTLFGRIIHSEAQHELEFLIDQTEAWCQERAVENAVMKVVGILEDGKKLKHRKGIPDLLRKALGVSFNTTIGHDYISDLEKRWLFHNTEEERIPFDLELLNTITCGGVTRKTLNVILAATNAGKSLFMCHCAAANLIARKKVLYITLEMAEEKIAERIDGNLTNVPITDMYKMTLEQYKTKMEETVKKIKGSRLFIKEFPTSAASALDFRNLLDELKVKKEFIPDIIYVDYLNIIAPTKSLDSNNSGSYHTIKAISEEVRAIAVDYNLPVITATQTNRDGYNNSDIDLQHTSEGYALNSLADLVIALINTEELADQNQIMVKQVKNRYNDKYKNHKFTIGIDRSRMKLYNISAAQQPPLF